MKKIYTFLMWMMAAMILAPLVTAKTVTVTVDNPDAASYRDPLNEYQTGQWNDDNSVVFEFTGDITIPVVANDGFEIEEATCNGETVAFGPAPSVTIATNDLEDGSVVLVSTIEKLAVELKIVGDPAKVYVSDQNGQTHGESDNVDGAWTVPTDSEWGTTSVYAKEGYLIVKAEDDKGNVYLTSSPNNYASISHNRLQPGLNTVTVEAKSEDEIYDGKITVNVDGQPYYVSLRFKDQYNGVNLNPGENTVRFNRDTDLPFTIRHGYDSEYNPMSLYQVSLNGTPLEAVDRVYTIESINNDDVIDIQVDAPAKDINISVLFADEDASMKALKAIRYDGETIDPEDYHSFTAQTGKSLAFEFDYKNYNVNMTENGNNVYISYGYVSRNLSNENGYTYMITASEIQPYKVTVICEQYEHLIVSSDYNGTKPYELTGMETEISVMPSDVYTYFSAEDGWLVKRVSNADTDATLSTGFNVTDGMKVFVELEEYVRDKHCTVYLDPVSWNYIYFEIAPNNYLVSKDLELEPGYQTVAFCDDDRPFNISGSDLSFNSPEIFLNGEKCEGMYGSYPALADLQDGDVIKIMNVNTPMHDVTYKISPAVNVKVVHDLTREIDHSAAHQAHSGTEIHIIPVSRAGIKVTAGGNEIVPDEEGKFVHIVSEPVEIAVDPALPTSILDIEASANEAVDVYNLQGVCVSRAATSAEINNLPAGIYVTAAGQKIVVK